MSTCTPAGVGRLSTGLKLPYVAFFRPALSTKSRDIPSQVTSSSCQKQLSNLYASPSIYITGRNSNPVGLIRAISADRMLVESDTHDVTRCTRLVWGATEWIARVKGWELESDTTENWSAESLVQSEEEWVRRNSRRAKRDGAVNGEDRRAQEGDVAKTMDLNEEAEKVWAVKTLERNWARFMGLIEPYE